MNLLSFGDSVGMTRSLWGLWLEYAIDHAYVASAAYVPMTGKGIINGLDSYRLEMIRFD